MSWTRVNLREVEDAAAAHGYSDSQEARFPREALGATSTGMAYLIIKPGRRQPFAHRHDEAEEVYVVIAGRGRLTLDDETHDVGPFDAVRIDPGVARGFEAGPDGMEILAFGPHHPGDAQLVDDLWERRSGKG
jgi:mannose-6-phosphate isomerase-like protein (cupin superfamily)